MSREILSYLSAAIMAATVSFALTWLLMPLLHRYALAMPNARSSHKHPTPQGAGIAVIAATLATAVVFAFAMDTKISVYALAATLLIAVVGAADDIRSLPVLTRLLAQTIAVSAILSTASGHLRLFPVFPFWIEQCVVLLAGVWFINLVNFMDGLDWMTVAEAVPVVAAIAVLGFLGHLSPTTAILASALGGALIGFAPFNRPVAKVFLGDVGSLPIGLLLGWCLLEVTYQGHLAAALLLPLYYLADATITMLRRLIAGDKIWTAHRCHFYQRAADNGAPAIQIVGSVFAVNILLAALAIVSVIIPSPFITALALAGGALIVALALFRFSWPHPRKT
ncbi:MAG: glycosyl transferase [Nitrobacter sp.]|uniref:glycosyl transferase n=1 Tax=Nitrobacter sp. TaxID=29420 RepID=UPI00261D5C6A|nr:glycosyl transferase [Nitrobacter sp.]MCV0386496.1 glycosyl transferase [Nitrobacter sp.]